MKQRNRFEADEIEKRIKEAFALYDQRDAERIHVLCLENGSTLPGYSEDFQRKIKRMIKTAGRPALFRKRAFKAIALVAAVLALMAIFAFGVTGIRERLFGIFLEEHPHYSIVLYSDESELKKKIETRYEPSFIPEGYDPPVYDDSGTSRRIYYYETKDDAVDDDLNREIFFYQLTKSGTLSVDTEEAEVRYIKFRNTDAVYIHKVTEYYYDYSLTWFEDGYIFRVGLLSTGDYESLIAIAESVRPVE